MKHQCVMWPAAGALSAPLKRRKHVLQHTQNLVLPEGKQARHLKHSRKTLQSHFKADSTILMGKDSREPTGGAQQSVPTHSELKTLFRICALDTRRIKQRCAQSADIRIKPFPQLGFITACKHINMICSSNSGFGLQRKDLITELTSDGRNHSDGFVPSWRLWAGEEPSLHWIHFETELPEQTAWKTREKSGWMAQGPGGYKRLFWLFRVTVYFHRDQLLTFLLWCGCDVCVKMSPIGFHAIWQKSTLQKTLVVQQLNLCCSLSET